MTRVVATRDEDLVSCKRFPDEMWGDVVFLFVFMVQIELGYPWVACTRILDLNRTSLDQILVD